MTIRHLPDHFIMGIAGNTPGHLAQVGETNDFSRITTQGENDPKCLFPVYVPRVDGLVTSPFPISSHSLVLPTSGDPVQLEPEVGLVCQALYEDGKLCQLLPHAAVAYNDCSIRIPDNDEKVSRRKNWGADSKGMAATCISLDGFAEGDEIDHYRLCAYLERDRQLHPYAVDTPVVRYSFFHGKLLDWIVERSNNQQDFRNLECIEDLLERSGHPERIIISLGAIEYTAYGERTFIRPGDVSYVVLYDGRRYASADIANLVRNGELENAKDVSALIQVVR